MKRFTLLVPFNMLIVLSLLLLTGTAASAIDQTTSPITDEGENVIQTGSAGIAWGDPEGEHPRYAWPFALSQMGHLISSYQNYYQDPNRAYFHHGIDMLAQDGTRVVTPVGGQVVNIENYGGSHLYWEVAILDPDGYVWQYHHIEQSSIPPQIQQAYQAYLANPENGGMIAANSQIGNIVTWPEFSFGFYFHHIHLNILAAGDIFLNPLDFLDDTYVDNQAPQVIRMGLFTGTNTLLTENKIAYGTPYSVYLQARDLFKSQVYYLPPHWITFSINGGEPRTVWNFRQLPGGSSETQFVNKFFLPGLTKGNYQDRIFYMDMGFTTDGVNPLPTDPGIYKMDVEIFDYAFNRANWSYLWIITQNISDNGCASGQGFRKTYTIEDDSYVQDIDLALAIEHAKRGELQVSLKGPMDSTPTILVAPGSDGNLNYNLLIDDASANPINDGNRDDLRPPFFNRSAGPAADGALDRYNGMNARGTWEVMICDNSAGNAGLIWDVDLRLLTSSNLPPVADDQSLTGSAGHDLPITLTGSDPEGAALTFQVSLQPQHGSLRGTAPDLIYTPDPGFQGVDQFSFKVNDGELDSEPAVVTINILPNLYLPLVLMQN